MGLQAAVAKSASLNDGKTLIHPIPMLSLRLDRLVLHSVYLPEVDAQKLFLGPLRRRTRSY